MSNTYSITDGYRLLLFLAENGFYGDLIGGVRKKGASSNDTDVLLRGNTLKDRDALKTLFEVTPVETDWGGLYFAGTAKFGDVDIFFSVAEFDNDPYVPLPPAERQEESQDELWNSIWEKATSDDMSMKRLFNYLQNYYHITRKS